MSLLVGLRSRIFRGKSFVIIRIIRENRCTSFLLGRTNVVATIFFYQSIPAQNFFYHIRHSSYHAF